MADENSATVLQDGQLAVATVAQSGDIISEPSEKDATCIVEDSNGKRYNAVKIVNFDDEPTTKSEIYAQILNNNNELITVTEEQEGEIIPQSNSQIDFHCLVQKDEGEQLSVKTVELEGEIIKTGGAIDTTCIVQGSDGKKQLALKVFKIGGGEIIETVSGTNSVYLPKAKANGLKSVKLFGGCEQSGTPTPTVPVDIVCNNGVLTFGATTTFNTADGQGTFVTPSQTVTTRIYKSFGKLKAGKYKVKITGDFEFIFQFKDTLDVNPTQYGNIGNWATEGEYDITDENMYYGVAIRNGSGSGNIYPSNFNNIGSIGYSYLGIMPVGTRETVEVTGKNLNGGGELDNKGYTSTGGASTSTTFCGTLWKIKVKAGEKYTVSYGNFPDGVSGVFVNTWKTDGTWNLRQAISISSAYTYTIPSGVGEVNFTLYKTGGITISSNSWLQVEKGETATDYEPYYNGGTATAEMLLSVGDYKDVQSVLDGAVTRKVGIKVLDGTENWSTDTYGGYRRFYLLNIAKKETSVTFCTHYKSSIEGGTGIRQNNSYIVSTGALVIYISADQTFTTVAEFNIWLADQYAQGTPVIVVYPLAESTTETVTPQTLQTQAGTNILQITQASIDNLHLEATYKRGK